MIDIINNMMNHELKYIIQHLTKNIWLNFKILVKRNEFSFI